MFPILGSGIFRVNVPWDFVEPARAQAMRNHSQTLELLAARGGLSFYELLCALEGRGLWDNKKSNEESQLEVQNRLRAFMASCEQNGGGE